MKNMIKPNKHGKTAFIFSVIGVAVFTFGFTFWLAPDANAQLGGGFGTAGPETMRVAGNWGGSVKTVDVVENIAYVGSGRRLVILDVSDQNNLVELGSVDMGNLVLDVQVRDGYAYIATWGNVPEPFSVVNVSDPTRPQIVRRISMNQNEARQMLLYGDVLFVRDRVFGGYNAFDITNPSNPQALGSFRPNGLAGLDIRDSVISEDLLYIVAMESSIPRLRVYDLATNFLDPDLFARIDLSGASDIVTGIAVEGEYAAVSVNLAPPQGGSMLVVDVAAPEAPVIIGSFEDIGGFTGVDFVDGVAYVAGASSPNWDGGTGQPFWNRSKGLIILDVLANPFQPELLATYKTHGSTDGVKVFGTTAYTFDRGEGLVLFDVLLPFAPERLDQFFSPAILRKATLVGDLLYVTDMWNGITILDVSGEGNPTVVGVYQNPRWGYVDHWGIDVEGDRAYFAAGWAGVQVVDVSDPTNPVLEGEYENWPPGIHAAAIEYDNGLAHVGTRASGGGGWFVNFHVSDPENILDVGNVELGGQPLTIRTTPEGIAHIGRGLHAIVDTSNPEQPFLILQQSSSAREIALLGNLAFVPNANTGSTGGLYIRDVSDPYNPVDLSHFVTARSGAVGVDGARAFVTGADLVNYLYMLNISNTGSPTLLSRLFLPGAASSISESVHSVVPNGRKVYVTASQTNERGYGVQVVSLGAVRPVSIAEWRI